MRSGAQAAVDGLGKPSRPGEDVFVASCKCHSSTFLQTSLINALTCRSHLHLPQLPSRLLALTNVALIDEVVSQPRGVVGARTG
jgi:hypothetical protein